VKELVVNRFQSNHRILQEKKEVEKRARSAEQERALNMAAPLNRAEREMHSCVSQLWREFVPARELGGAEVESLPMFQGFSLKARKPPAMNHIWEILLPAKRVSFLLRLTWGDGLLLIQPSNWRRTANIPRDATDLADAISEETGKPVTLMQGRNILYRTQSEEATGVIPFQASA